MNPISLDTAPLLPALALPAGAALAALAPPTSPTSPISPISLTPESSAFDLLHPRIQHFLWNEGWSELRDIQEQAIQALCSTTASGLPATSWAASPSAPVSPDLVLAASTASGKTEAAFLPLLSQILFDEEEATSYGGVHPDQPVRDLLVYVSPLKALINDQFSRLSYLCDHLDIPVWPWHGDVGATTKKRFQKERRGILLITPESLEAFFCNQGSRVAQVFERTRAVVVDELHAFMGEERGKQMQSLLHRMDDVLGRKVPRIGLSATLGDMKLAAEFLHPGAVPSARVIDSRSGGELLILVKGYVEPAAPARPVLQPEFKLEAKLEAKTPALGDLDAQYDDEEEVEDETGGNSLDTELSTTADIVQHLFKSLRGSNNLVFPNTRNAVERYALKLRSLCAAHRMPNEFWPHHGSLSRELREEAEQALKSEQTCATAICTNTLELGIDIGEVKSVAQIGPAPSVASLRQRLGRSGRRDGEPAILRGYCQEHALTAQSHMITQLREELFQMTAMVELLLAGWFEPPQVGGLHFSTLVQQLMALISQRAGIAPAEAFRLLCRTGPFSEVTPADFSTLLRHLGKTELLIQDSSGILLHGPKVERVVNHHTFYAAFATQEEYRLVCSGRTLGSVPLSNALSGGDLLVFGGKTWRVSQVDDKSKVVEVVRTRAGKAPRFESDAGFVHTRVRQQMRTLYESTTKIAFLDATAAQLLGEGRETYRRYGLAGETLVPYGSSVLMFTWLGDRENNALVHMLKRHGIAATAEGPALELPRCSLDLVGLWLLMQSMARGPMPTPADLLTDASNLAQEKWDWALPLSLLQNSFSSLKLDIAGAHAWLGSVTASMTPASGPGSALASACGTEPTVDMDEPFPGT